MREVPQLLHWAIAQFIKGGCIPCEGVVDKHLEGYGE